MDKWHVFVSHKPNRRAIVLVRNKVYLFEARFLHKASDLPKGRGEIVKNGKIFSQWLCELRASACQITRASFTPF